jgi:hypothetical protein
MLLFGEVCANGGLAVYGSRTEARSERDGRATGPYGRSAARHSARGVVRAQKSAEVIVVAPVRLEATKDRTSQDREEL